MRSQPVKDSMESTEMSRNDMAATCGLAKMVAKYGTLEVRRSHRAVIWPFSLPLTTSILTMSSLSSGECFV